MSIILSPALADLYSSLGDSEERFTITKVSWKQYDKLYYSVKYI